LQGGAALNETAIEMIVSLLGTRLKLNIVQWLLIGAIIYVDVIAILWI